MGYGFSLELESLITAFAELYRVVMIDSSPSILQDDISTLHFHVGETNAPAAQKTCWRLSRYWFKASFYQFSCPCPLLETSLLKII